MSRPNPTKATNNAFDPIGKVRTSRRSFLGATATTTLALGALRMPAGHAVAAQSQADTGVQVYPPHGTRTASPYTEISFRGITEEELGPVDVAGNEIGGNSGILRPHADGNGVSYVPDARFQPGERVTVRAAVPLSPTEDGVLVFYTARPAELVQATDNEVVDEPEVAPWEFLSRPDLKPPVMEVTTPARNVAPGYVFAAAKIPNGQNGVLILDNAGDTIWFGPPEVKDYIHYDFRVQRYQDEPALTWYEGVRAGGFGRGHYVIANASYERIAEFHVGNGFTDGGDLHEFLLTSRGTALVTIYHAVDWDVSPVGGSKYGSVFDCVVQELEIESGRVLFEWHALDHVAVDETTITVEHDSDEPFDFFHINSIQEVGAGNLVVSARHTNAIYHISRSTGEVIWRLNGTGSDFNMGEGTPFAWQHDARVHPDGTISLFDNHDAVEDHEDTEDSRGLVLELDTAAMTATMVQEYVHPDGYLSGSQGNMQLLPNGNIFIGWGSEPAYSEFTPDGTLIFNCRFPGEGTSYRAYREEWTGQPVDPPDIAVEQASQNAATVHASWNGATEVASWGVLAGATAAALEVVGQAGKAGFETTIQVDVGDGFFAVQALDASGAVIGTSDTIQSATAS